MAKLYQNISNLVFRRNIPFKLETYIVNCEMLQVLAELDGIKNVSVIAAKLNREISDLVTTFAALYQQKLILLVKPNPAVVSKPHLKNSIINDIKKIDSGDLKPFPPTRPKSGTGKQLVNRNLIRKAAPRSQRESKKLPPLSNSNSLGPWHPSKSNMENRHATPKAVFDLYPNYDGKKHNQRSDIFRINKPKQSDQKQVFDTSLSAPRASTLFINQKAPGLPESDNLYEKAIEYFENGLALLKHRYYQEALTQFEKSLGLNPQNRLCRANIQRIRKLLEKNGSGNFKIPT